MLLDNLPYSSKIIDTSITSSKIYGNLVNANLLRDDFVIIFIAKLSQNERVPISSSNHRFS